MPVVAVVNHKGGSGKSTLATHIAAWCASNGSAVMLGDVDRQQSARTWLKRRSSALPKISPWMADQTNLLRAPIGITHAVLDTPGGLRGLELARVVMCAHAIVIPLCDSLFDRESAAACYAELMTLPRVSSGRCPVAVVGMRVDSGTPAAHTLRTWAQELSLPFLGSLRESNLYVRSVERGMTVFDLSPHMVSADLAQWQPILEWLTPVMYPVPADTVKARGGVLSAAATGRMNQSLPPSLMPAQKSLVHGERFSASRAARPI